MAHADGVHAKLFKIFKTCAPDGLGNHSPEHTGIVMQTHALHLHIPAIECEPLVRAKVQSAQSEACIGLINNFPVTFKGSAEGVKIRRFNIPQAGILPFQRQFIFTVG